MKKIFFLLNLGLILSLFSAAQNSAWEKKLYISGSDTLRYRILYPLNYDASKKYPLVFFLHGSGERGNDNELQLVHGSILFEDSGNRQKFPSFIIFPQCSKDDSWSRMKRNPSNNDSLGGMLFPTDQPIGKSAGLAVQLLDSLANSKNVNSKRIYIGGLSMGGMGTFELFWHKPGFFAAAFPICGGGNPESVKLYAKKFPVWIFHGDKDPAVPVSNSRLMNNALKKAGAKVKYTEYPGVGHNSWDNAFAEPDLLPWLFKQKRK
ncbi:MAG: phospholipase [Chitinophagaceae bacterium]|nr:MAG: phospholipase [Chitinophagaceae bacterium]